MPPPPKPATSPAAYRPGSGSPSARSTRDAGRSASPPRVLRVSTCSLTAISGPAVGSSSRCGAADADQPVAAVAAGAADGGDLRVLAERVGDLAVAGDDLPLDRRPASSSGVARSAVHPVDQLGAGCRRTTKSAPCSLERLAPARARPAGRGEHLPDVLAGEVGVLLRARQRELLLDDLLGQDEPGVVVPGGAQVGQRAEGVEAGEQRRRAAAGRARRTTATTGRAGCGCRGRARSGPSSGCPRCSATSGRG